MTILSYLGTGLCGGVIAFLITAFWRGNTKYLYWTIVLVCLLFGLLAGAVLEHTS